MKKKASRKKSTRFVKEWSKQAEWLLKYIEQLPRMPSAHGLKWTTKMIAHYVGKFDVMYDSAPRACRKQAKAYKLRVDTVRNWAIKHSEQ